MLDALTLERMTAEARGGPVLVALSGGGDSVALLHLLCERLGAAALHAAVIDHGLREGSAEDARRAASFALGLGVQAPVLPAAWDGAAKRAQEAARRARYAALCAHARAVGAAIIAAAHTADDQAETVLMRAAAGSTWRGLAGMAPLAPAPLWPEGRGLTLARPLLRARRADLRLMLRARAADWIEDPANADPAFERVRARARLTELEAAGFDPLRLARMASRLRPHVDALDRAAAALIDASAAVGLRTHITRARWRGPAEVRRRALAALMAAVAGAPHAPATAALETLEARLMAAGFAGATHGGVRFTPAPGGVRLTRDPGAALGRSDGAPAPPPLPLAVGEEAVWDGRVALIARAPGWRCVAADNADLAALEHEGRRWPLDRAPAAVAVRALTFERLRHVLGRAVNGAQGA